MNHSDVSILILTWDGNALADACIRSVLKCTPRIAEILVCDNGSDERHAERLRKEFGDAVRCVRFEKNLGFTEGYNAGIKELRTPIIVALNDDTEVTDGWLEPLLATMEDGSIAACQPKLRSLRDRSSFDYSGACGGYLDRFGYPFARGRLLDVIEKDEGQYDAPVDIHWASSACIVLRRELWERYGRFGAMDEISLCWRWRKEGYRIRVVPSSIVYHRGAELWEYSVRRRFLSHRNNLYAMLSLGSPRQLLSALLPRLGLELCAVVYLLAKGKPAAAMAVFAAFFAFFACAPAAIARRGGGREAPLLGCDIIREYFWNSRRTFRSVVRS